MNMRFLAARTIEYWPKRWFALLIAIFMLLVVTGIEYGLYYHQQKLIIKQQQLEKNNYVKLWRNSLLQRQYQQQIKVYRTLLVEKKLQIDKPLPLQRLLAGLNKLFLQNGASVIEINPKLNNLIDVKLMGHYQSLLAIITKLDYVSKWLQIHKLTWQVKQSTSMMLHMELIYHVSN